MYQRIRDLREDNDFTQKFVAEILIKLSALYNVSTDYILGLSDCPQRIKQKIK
ncbi:MULTISPECIES: XRE family transcriptional regulator [Streptococcus]|uniref:XRE family transcriptional regulator n=1 Tax=Streptococcus TaxID=1301 RepID=UPI00294A09D4|nr:XRE family transcriptional regulator [Streptococcus canis]MDV5973850.1 XRE family transcriptional regulator [Streptococcus canis]